MTFSFKNIFSILLYIFLFNSFSSCKKYPEDETFSIKTAKQRLKSGIWYFNKLLINGNDSTLAHLHKFAPNNDNPRYFSFFISKGFDYKSDAGSAELNDFYKYLIFNLRFVDKKKKLNINPVFYSTNTNHSLFWVGGSNREWKIIKLTKDNLIIETEYNYKSIRFEFKH